LVDKSILFSVIIPTYNRAEMLMEALASVVKQVNQDVEIIVVDDGSTDSTKDKLRDLGLPYLRYVYQENQGQSVARNLGVDMAMGKYVIFLDDDDYWLDGHLDVFRNAIQRDDRASSIFRTGFRRIYDSGKEKIAPNYRVSKDGHPVEWAAYNMCGLWSLCIPRKYLLENKSPVGFPHWQDTHLILRLLAQFPFKQLEEVTYGYRIHEEMGSFQIRDRDHLLKRAESNVSAIDDLFENYETLINSFLSRNTLKYLKAEKYLEYANLALVRFGGWGNWQLFKRSIHSKIDLRLWKEYVVYIKHLIFK